MDKLTTTSPKLSLDIIAKIDDSYNKYRKLFIDYQRTQKRTTFTYDDIFTYYAYLKKKGLKASTINTSMACLKRSIRKVMENERDSVKLFYLEKRLDAIPREQIQSKSVDSEDDKIPSEAEINILLQRASYKLALFIRFLAHTGCRISELTGITLTNIKVELGFYRITIIGKGNKERNLKLNKDLVDNIRDHFKGNRFLFETGGKKRYRETYITTQIQRLSRRTLNKMFCSHSFRHYFCTQMIQKTGDIKGVSDYVGHSSTAITLDMYTHSVLSIKQLEQMLY